jgi:hypothetical protein
VLQDTTEMADDRGVFYRQTLTDTIRELSAPLTDSDF